MTTIQRGQLAHEWAREHGEHFTVTTHLDNHEPPRRSAALVMHRFVGHSGDTEYMIESGVDLLDTHCGFLLDDGYSVIPLYVAGWHSEHKYILAHKFPLDFNPTTREPNLRADNGRPVDHSTWILGPRRYYHLKVVR